ncbi:MAG: transglycosylase domain-containing protein, partial [Raoultibacter sp.]
MASRSIKNRPNIKKKNPFTGVLVALSIIIVVLCAGVAGVWALGESWLTDLPDYEDADQYNTARKTEVFANDGTTLLAEFYLENREPVELNQISKFVLEGTVATEDERFYEHGGFDIWGIARALVVNLSGSSREGA